MRNEIPLSIYKRARVEFQWHLGNLSWGCFRFVQNLRWFYTCNQNYQNENYRPWIKIFDFFSLMTNHQFTMHDLHTNILFYD